MAWFKKKNNPAAIPVQSQSNARSQPVQSAFHYFGNVVEITENEGGGIINAVITTSGEQKLNSLDHDELLLYFKTISETTKINIIANLLGNGPACLARDFLAFRCLTQTVLERLERLSDKKQHLKNRYDMAKNPEGIDPHEPV